MSIGAQAVPFELRTRSSETSRDDGGIEVVQTDRLLSGLLRLEEDALVLQFRVRETVLKSGNRAGVLQRTTESEIQERRIPLPAIRSARVQGWWRRRLVIAAADLRAFEGLPVDARGELSLVIARRDRTDAVELASHVEYALAQHLLAPAPDPRELGPGPDSR